MGLNDDVDEGLELVDDPQLLNPEQPIPEKITIEPAMDFQSATNPVQTEVTDEQLFGVGAVKNEVPNLNAEFLVVTERLNKAHDLLSVSQDIRASSGICKEDAEVINSLTPGFISDKKPLGVFTEQKSRTQYTETLNTLNKTVDIQISEIAIKSNELCDRASAVFTPALDNVEARITARFTDSQDTFAQIVTALSENQSKASVLIKQFLDHALDGIHAHRDESCHKELFDLIGPTLDQTNEFSKTVRNLENVYCLLYYHHLYGSSDEKVLFSINYKNAHAVVTTESPFFSTLSHEEDPKLPRFTFYDLVMQGADTRAKHYLMQLSNTVTNIVAGMKERKAIIESLNADAEINISEKLAQMFFHHSENAKDCVNSFYLLSFIEEYCQYIEKVTVIVKMILKQENTPT